MAGFIKLFGSILRSTVWGEPDATRIVWITMMALADRDGIVEASVPGLAHDARVTLEQAQAALSTFLAPDPHSRTKDFDGRRIEEVRGGWRLLNHDLYREKLDAEDQRDKAAERKRRQRRRADGSDASDAQQTIDVTSERDMSRDGVTERDKRDESRMSRHTDPDPDPKEDQSQKPSRLSEPKGKRGYNAEQVEAAARVWAFLNRCRQHVMPTSRELAANQTSLDMICKLFTLRHTEDDVKAVIRQYGREVQHNPESGKYFDGVTPFRPENFLRALGKVGTGAAPSNGNGATSNGGQQRRARSPGQYPGQIARAAEKAAK